MKNKKPVAKARMSLSKSRILSHRQCPKRLYLQTFRPELAEDSFDSDQAFAIGHEVGELARRQFANGLLIGHDADLKAALAQTREALEFKPKRPLFEPTFEHHGVLVRADLLLPDKRGHRLVEVKSSAKMKPHYLEDCAIQAWVIESTGHNLKRVKLAHIDTGFVYPGNDDYDGLLREQDITRDVRAMANDVPNWIRACRKTLDGPEPKIEVGDQCDKPYACPFLSYCLGPQPKYPVSTLSRGGKLVSQLLADGITDLRDVPLDRLKNPIHLRQVRTVKRRKAELDPAAREVFAGLPFPRFYVDFETIFPAVPVWPGTRPYHHVPFQWSCHIELANGKLEHREFLGLPPEAPMRRFATSLIEVLGKAEKSPIFVYNRGFEGSRLRELALMYPDLAAKLKKIEKRLVDLWPVARAHYYHPDMHGSWSIKDVLPTIAPELDYEDLNIVQHGGAAMDAYRELLAPETPAKRKQQLIEALRSYCELDTLAMVRLARFLEQRVR